MESKHILIADAGGTKITWALINKQTQEHQIIETSGVNAYFFTEDQIHEMLESQLFKKIETTNISNVFYYGAGCADQKNAEKIANTIKRTLKDSNVLVNTDVMGSARALCGNEKGIACILGTGSSVCYFDGNEIARNREGLGYALGDEGGGAQIGKLILQQYLFKHFDDKLRENFVKKFGELSRNEILEHVYKKEAPNNYLGSFSVFASENRGHPLIEKLVRKAIGEFIEISIEGLTDDKNIPINFIGSIALVFEDIVKELLGQRGYKTGKFLKNPMDGLISFHLNS